MSRKVSEGEITRFLDAWLAVRQFIQAANFNHFHKAGLSATQFMTLNLLPEKGDSIAIGELAKRMNLKPATLAKTVDSLEAREMLRRTKSTSDGRRVLLTITESGRKLQNAAVGQFRQYISGIFREMLAADREGLIHGLEGLVRVANADGSRTPTVLSRAARASLRVKRSSRKSPLR